MPWQSTIWLDGTQTSVYPLPDRGLDFGDGLFETLLVDKGKPLFAEYHLERLALGLRVLSIPDCLESARWQLERAALSTKEKCHWAVMRLSVLRGPGPRGYASPIRSTPRILISVSAMDRDCTKMGSAATLSVATIRLASQPVLAGIKHLNRLEQIIAANQAQVEGNDECVVLDQTERVNSVVSGNIFLVRNGKLLTPKLVDCGVAGTRRRLIMEKWAPSIGMKAQETSLSLSDFNRADEVFYSNSLQPVRPIAKLCNRTWNHHPVCEALFQRYLEELQ